MSFAALALMLMGSVQAFAAENDDTFSVWNDIQITKNLGKYSISLRGEHWTGDRYFVQPSFGVKPLSWLKLDAGYFWIDRYKTADKEFRHRAFAQATFTAKNGPLSVSLRERYMYEWINKGGVWSGNNVMRHRLMAQYAATKSVKPYLAAEVFHWTKWTMTRHYVGTVFTLAKGHDLDLFYMYLTNAGKPAQHTLGLGYHFTF